MPSKQLAKNRALIFTEVMSVVGGYSLALNDFWSEVLANETSMFPED